MTIVDLINGPKSPIVQNMNALEIIEEIKQLPEDERGKVVEFMRHIPNAETIAAINEPLEEGRSFKNAAELFAELDKEC